MPFLFLSFPFLLLCSALYHREKSRKVAKIDDPGGAEEGRRTEDGAEQSIYLCTTYLSSYYL